MSNGRWQDTLLPPGNQDHVWEIFHENSKISRYTYALAKEEVQARRNRFYESLPFEGYPVVELPTELPALKLFLDDIILARRSTRKLIPCEIHLESLATLLYYAYGVRSENSEGTATSGSFRVVPSGGALYPLEIFFYSAHVRDLKPGLYHYNPCDNHLRLVQEGDHLTKLSKSLVQPEIGTSATLVLFITAAFERSVFKYGDRGYRFILLEAGHVAQNVNLVSTALGLGCLSIGGFFDRDIDSLLGIDGLTHSTIYLMAIGKNSESSESDGDVRQQAS